MKFLANENFPGDAVEAVRTLGHDVAWIRAESPGAADDEVLARAVAESRTLITFDKDFGVLAFRAKLPATCGIVLFRIPTPSAAVVAAEVARAIGERVDWAGHFSVVEPHRVRMRDLPSAP